MPKHLVEIDTDLLGAARAELGTTTLKATVEAALRRAVAGRDQRVRAALDALAGADLADRSDAWR
jgi:Arc/MetJ family transcription regulator